MWLQGFRLLFALFRCIMWGEVVFAELTDVLTPVQIEHLFERMEKDFSATCTHFREMAEAQRLLEQDEGGAG